MTVEYKPMEAKKVSQPQHAAPSVAKPAQGSYSIKKMADYFADVKREFYKISWTSKDELKVYTLVVVIATFFLGLGVYFVDVAIQLVLALFDSFIRVLFG